MVILLSNWLIFSFISLQSVPSELSQSGKRHQWLNQLPPFDIGKNSHMFASRVSGSQRNTTGVNACMFVCMIHCYTHCISTDMFYVHVVSMSVCAFTLKKMFMSCIHIHIFV